MEKRGLSQEGLKLLACAAMLVDHLGVTLFPQIGFRIVGRMAFPIFCFLLAEGVYHTRDPKKYGFRLFLAMLLSEIPFDLMNGSLWDPSRQNVMLTLLLGFLALSLGKELCCPAFKLSLGLFMALTAELLNGDYGAQGVLIILLFGYARELELSLWKVTALLLLICVVFPGYKLPVLGFSIPIESFGVLSMVPIALYGGNKRTHSPALQWAFYLFYPVHMLLLGLLKRL